MSSKSYQNFMKNKEDIENLWSIHTKVTGENRGRRSEEVEILHRSAIVFITACWEAYIEDVAIEAFDFLLKKISSVKQCPGKVLNFIASRSLDLKNTNRNISNFWKPAEQGWKRILRRHKNEVIQEWVESLNTPKTENVDKLFEKLLGIKNVSDSWCWPNMNCEKAQSKLDEYIIIRGDITHRVKTKIKMNKNHSWRYLNHVYGLAIVTDTCVRNHIENTVGYAPWPDDNE